MAGGGLSVEQHPGDTVSSSQAEALVRAAKARTGAHPWRRTELLVGKGCRRWAQGMATLSALYRARNRPERPESLLAQARRKLAVRERWLGQRQKELEGARRWLERCRRKVADLEAELAELEQCLAQFGDRSSLQVGSPSIRAPDHRGWGARRARMSSRCIT